METNLSNANLSKANLIETDLSNANLSGAKLPGALLYLANLSNANLTGANLTGAWLSNADMREADMTGADLSEATGDEFTQIFDLSRIHDVAYRADFVDRWKDVKGAEDFVCQLHQYQHDAWNDIMPPAPKVGLWKKNREKQEPAPNTQTP